MSLIFDIKRYAINDGPGIRTTIFFKGCPLSCDWCHNPESQSKEKEKMVSKNKCIACQICVVSCEQGAITYGENGIETDLDACIKCGKCEEVCPTGATEFSGKEISDIELLEAIKKETLLMDKSEGGVTFSGGEVLMQGERLLKLLKECKSEAIHTCVDTSGQANSDTLLEVQKYTDLFLYDLKHMDSGKHKEAVGVKNDLILKNLRLLSKTNSDIIIRIPLIKGYNDDEENISKTIEFILSLDKKPIEINLLPYHNIASKKYEKLGTEYKWGHLIEPTLERQEEIIALFANNGLKCKTGG